MRTVSDFLNHIDGEYKTAKAKQRSVVPLMADFVQDVMKIDDLFATKTDEEINDFYKSAELTDAQWEALQKRWNRLKSL